MGFLSSNTRTEVRNLRRRHATPQTKLNLVQTKECLNRLVTAKRYRTLFPLQQNMGTFLVGIRDVAIYCCIGIIGVFCHPIRSDKYSVSSLFIYLFFIESSYRRGTVPCTFFWPTYFCLRGHVPQPLELRNYPTIVPLECQPLYRWNTNHFYRYTITSTTT